MSAGKLRGATMALEYLRGASDALAAAEACIPAADTVTAAAVVKAKLVVDGIVLVLTRKLEKPIGR